MAIFYARGGDIMAIRDNGLGDMLKSRRLMMTQTLRELANATAVSQSYLGRIERGERFPSASVLRKIAQPLGFTEVELLTAAGYLWLFAFYTERHYAE